MAGSHTVALLSRPGAHRCSQGWSLLGSGNAVKRREASPGIDNGPVDYTMYVSREMTSQLSMPLNEPRTRERKGASKAEYVKA